MSTTSDICIFPKFFQFSPIFYLYTPLHFGGNYSPIYSTPQCDVFSYLLLSRLHAALVPMKHILNDVKNF